MSWFRASRRIFIRLADAAWTVVFSFSLRFIVFIVPPGTHRSYSGFRGEFGAGRGGRSVAEHPARCRGRVRGGGNGCGIGAGGPAPASRLCVFAAVTRGDQHGGEDRSGDREAGAEEERQVKALGQRHGRAVDAG